MSLSRTAVGSLAVLAATLVFAVVLGFVLAFGSSEPDPWEERWAELGVPEAEFVFLGDLSSSEQKSMKRELRVAQVVLAERFGAVSSDFTVYVGTELDALNEPYAEHVGQGAAIPFTCGGIAAEGAIFLILEMCPDEERPKGGPLAGYLKSPQRSFGLILRRSRNRKSQCFWALRETAGWAVRPSGPRSCIYQHPARNPLSK